MDGHIGIQKPTQGNAFHGKVYVTRVLGILDGAAEKQYPPRAKFPERANDGPQLLFAQSHAPIVEGRDGDIKSRDGR